MSLWKALERKRLCVLCISVCLVSTALSNLSNELSHILSHRILHRKNFPFFFPIWKWLLEGFLGLLETYLNWIFLIFLSLCTLLLSFNIKFILSLKFICIWELKYINFIFNSWCEKFISRCWFSFAICIFIFIQFFDFGQLTSCRSRWFTLCKVIVFPHVSTRRLVWLVVAKKVYSNFMSGY